MMKNNNPIIHTILVDKGGEGIDGWLQSVCTCGWQGQKEYAWGSRQHMNIIDQKLKHLREATNEQN